MRKPFLAGVQAISPILLGVVPFALIAGISAVGAGLSPEQAATTSVVVFAGASQLAAVQLIGAGAAAVVVILTAFVINLRFVMYSASIAPHLSHLPVRWRWLLAYLLTDQAYAVSITHFDQMQDAENKHWYYLGTALPLWAVWQVGTLVGILVGAQIPPNWSLDFAIPLTFGAVVIPALKDRAAVAAALCAGLVAVVAAGLPFNLGLITGAAAGILAGLLAEEMGKGRTKNT